jgi:LacI family transcriptional regulator
MSMADGFRHMGAILRRRRPLDALLAVNLLVHLGMERRLLEYDSAAKSQGVGDRKTECSSTVKSRAASNTTDAAIHTPCGLPVIAGFDESPYTPFLPACRYTAAQDAAAIGREAGRCILEKIVRTQEQKKSSGAGENAGNAEARIIRLPVKIIRHEQRGINFPDYRNA